MWLVVEEYKSIRILGKRVDVVVLVCNGVAVHEDGSITSARVGFLSQWERRGMS